MAESNHEVNANRPKRGPWEIFKVLKQPDGTYGFMTAHGRYLVAEGNGRLRGDRKELNNWEKFTPECI